MALGCAQTSVEEATPAAPSPQETGRPYLRPERANVNSFPVYQRKLVIKVKAADELIGSYLGKSDILGKGDDKRVVCCLSEVRKELAALGYKSDVSDSVLATFEKMEIGLYDKSVDDTDFTGDIISVRSILGWLLGEMLEAEAQRGRMT